MGARLVTNRVKVCERVNKDYSCFYLTIPKKLAVASGFTKGVIVHFQYIKEGQIIMHKVA